MKNSYEVKWNRDDLRKHAHRRLAHALIEAGETLDDVIRTMLIVFIEDIEENGMEGYPQYCANSLGDEPVRVRRIQEALSR